MSRPSHHLPRAVFDAILDLEEAARRDATFHAEHIAGGHHTSDQSAQYLRLVVETGAKRDRLAQLLHAREVAA